MTVRRLRRFTSPCCAAERVESIASLSASACRPGAWRSSEDTSDCEGAGLDAACTSRAHKSAAAKKTRFMDLIWTTVCHRNKQGAEEFSCRTQPGDPTIAR